MTHRGKREAYLLRFRRHRKPLRRTRGPRLPGPRPPESKTAEVVTQKVAPKKPENSISPKAAEYKGRIEEAISEKGLNGHVKVQAAGNTLTLAGKLRPAEHGALLKLLRNAPSDVRVIDHLEYDDTPVAATGSPDEG